MADGRARWTASFLVAVAAAALVTSVAPEARAQTGGQGTGDLGAGGTARGDISTTAGEYDLVGVHAQPGQRVRLSLVANFHAAIELLDPSGAPMPVNFTTGSAHLGAAVTTDTGGTYTVRISSADGSQGFYSLTAAVRWPSHITATMQSGDPLGFFMPEGGTVTATIKAKPAKSWDPQIASLTGPGDTPLLGAPIAGAKGVARLPKTRATATGAHVLSVAGGPAGAAFRAALVVKSAPVKPASIDLRNGLTPTAFVSFRNDGVSKIFMNRCAGCHGWASSYAGVRSQADWALLYIQAGAMPLGSSRLPRAQVTLIQDWIDTGENP